jgi:hypothetical protein
VTFPNGGECWQVGSSHNITWTSTGNVGSVQIQYSTDSGTSWTHVGGSTNDGIHPWQIPNIPSTSTQCLVKVSEIGSSTSDTSNSVFTIAASPTLTVTSPNGGESLIGGLNHNVTWVGFGGSGTVKIDYTTNNGNNWAPVVASTTDDGSYTWNIPSTPSIQCLVRISDTADINNFDTSDSVFSIISSMIQTKNDFNHDGQGDILWRHYGNGKNALWYMGSRGATGLSQGNVETMFMDQGPQPAQIYQDVLEAGEILYMDERVYHDILDIDVPHEKIVEKVYWNAIEAGDDLYRPGKGGIVGDMQALMEPGILKAGIQASIIGTAYLGSVADTNWRMEGTGDFNGDGSVDILWRHYGTGKNSLWLMNGAAVIGTASLITLTDLKWRIGGTGDFNGDGYVDILWRHYVTGQNALWYMNGSVIIGTRYLSSVADVNWKIGGTGDFNGDGHVDILWRHYATGKNALWYLDGSTLTGTAYLYTLANLNWVIEGTGDFNNDGRTDILWRHYGYGANAVWYMNGSTIIGTEHLYTLADVNWRMENH